MMKIHNQNEYGWDRERFDLSLFVPEGPIADDGPIEQPDTIPAKYCQVCGGNWGPICDPCLTKQHKKDFPNMWQSVCQMRTDELVEHFSPEQILECLAKSLQNECNRIGRDWYNATGDCEGAGNNTLSEAVKCDLLSQRLLRIWRESK